MRLREWLDNATNQLRGGSHAERARPDAEALLLHHIGRNRAWLLAHLDDEFGGCTSIGYARLIERRMGGEPIQYIVGETEFYGLPFRVNRDVLIPRPETEHLVEKIVELAPLFRQPRIVDVGTGSGAIAIAVAYEWPSAKLTAIDISERALEVAEANAKRVGFGDRIRFLQGDLLAPVAEERFEIVVSNPPYVAEGDRATLAAEVREFEPAKALFAGASGLDIYKRLIPAAHAVLVDGGWIALEIGYGQRDEVAALLTENGFREIGFTADLQGIDRVAIGRR